MSAQTVIFKEQNLQGQAFGGWQLHGASFSKCDLRSADFSNTNLKAAVFSECTFGLKPFYRILLFMLAIALSFCSGAIAMLSGTTLQTLLRSPDWYLRIAGYIIAGLCCIAIIAVIKMGVNKASLRIFVLLIAVVTAIGSYTYLTDVAGTGVGTIYGLATLLLLLAMFVVGCIGRATAGTLGSTILFIVVALGGGMFGKSLGGGMGTIVMAISSAFISKKALSSKEDSFVKIIALYISTRFGTRFSGADLSGAKFSNCKIENTDFKNALTEGMILDNAEKIFCYK